MRVQASRGAGAALAKSVALYYNFQARATGSSEATVAVTAINAYAVS